MTTALGVLTSGGDAQGMNAAVRAVTRAALARGVPVFAIYEGYEGMVQAGTLIRPLRWGDVGGILHKGGTVIGTARSQAFRTRAGRLQAARNLVERGIDRLVVIGGDGSLTGANLFRQEWAGLLQELLETGQITAEQAETHQFLAIVGLVGSIDNDMVGTDMTIGADTALHRITEALDSLASTAASHQRAFVVEVMGRNCGYLALMGAVAGGGDFVLIPESPPEPGWEQRMCDTLGLGRKAGRRDSIVVIAEGARDTLGNHISADYVKQVLEQRLGEDTRVTILGHVQRGGAPSAFDRWMSTLIGFAAVEEVLKASADSEPQLIGMRYNRVTHEPLMQCVEQTRAVAATIEAHEYDKAMALRGGSFTEMFRTFHTLAQIRPSETGSKAGAKRLLVMHAGGPAPGMNTAVRAAVRLSLDQGHDVFVAHDGFRGLMQGQIAPFSWSSVNGWGSMGGAELGTNRSVPRSSAQIATVAQQLAAHRIDGLLLIGGWTAVESAHALVAGRLVHAALRVPIVVIPAAIDNNMPGSEQSIGADTALNSIVRVVDQIKQSAVAGHRCFVIEVMGHQCGYLALMSGIATGAERVYLPEDGVSLRDLGNDVQRMMAGFRSGKRLGLIIRNEDANPTYSTKFMVDLFEEEGGELFEARQAILGHLQQGGNPTPFDRIQATRLAARGVQYMTETLDRGSDAAGFIGINLGRVEVIPLERLPALADHDNHRPREQWWMSLKPVAATLAQHDAVIATVSARQE